MKPRNFYKKSQLVEFGQLLDISLTLIAALACFYLTKSPIDWRALLP